MSKKINWIICFILLVSFLYGSIYVWMDNINSSIEKYIRAMIYMTRIILPILTLIFGIISCAEFNRAFLKEEKK